MWRPKYFLSWTMQRLKQITSWRQPAWGTISDKLICPSPFVKAATQTYIVIKFKRNRSYRTNIMVCRNFGCHSDCSFWHSFKNSKEAMPTTRSDLRHHVTPLSATSSEIKKHISSYTASLYTKTSSKQQLLLPRAASAGLPAGPLETRQMIGAAPIICSCVPRTAPTSRRVCWQKADWSCNATLMYQRRAPPTKDINNAPVRL